MAKIGLGAQPGLFKWKKARAGVKFRDYNKKHSAKSVVSSLDSEFKGSKTLNPTSPFFVYGRRNHSGLRACVCGHGATDHQLSQVDCKDRRLDCGQIDCGCEKYEKKTKGL